MLNPQPVVNGDYLFLDEIDAYGTTWHTSGRQLWKVAGSVINGKAPSSWQIETTDTAGTIAPRITIDGSGDVNLGGGMKLNDSKKLRLGTDNDAEIYFNGLSLVVNPGINPVEVTRGKINLRGADGDLPILGLFAHSSAIDWHSSLFQSNRSRGTEAAPQAVVAGDDIHNHSFYGYNGWSYNLMGQAMFEVYSAPLASGNIPGRYTFYLRDIWDNYFERFTIDSYGVHVLGDSFYGDWYGVVYGTDQDAKTYYDGAQLVTTVNNGSGLVRSNVYEVRQIGPNENHSVQAYQCHSNNGGHSNLKQHLRSRGTGAAPASTAIWDRLGMYQFYGFGQLGWTEAAEIVVDQCGNITTNGYTPGRFVFYTRAANESFDWRGIVDERGFVGPHASQDGSGGLTTTVDVTTPTGTKTLTFKNGLLTNVA
jgi:hypothetical protein